MIDTTRDFLDYSRDIDYDTLDWLISQHRAVLHDIDEIDLTNVRAFTWSPNPLKYPSFEPELEYRSLLKHVLVNSEKYFTKFCFVPEINQQGHIHIHGWYIIRDKIKYYRDFLPRCREYGYVLEKQKVDVKWFGYMNKELDMTYGVVGPDVPILLHHLNIQSHKYKFKNAKLIKRVLQPKPKSVLGYFRNK